MGILLHGDAAFAGQGIVWETLSLGDLPDYSTGGTVHIIVNNQIGFTTDPAVARSTPYCSDLAKSVNAPIFHVNGDDPEAVVRVCQIAAEWRQKFHKDVVIDLVSYRRHGHNEIDEPSFTQPLMYQKINSMPSTLNVYQKRLEKEGIVAAREMEEIRDKVKNHLQQKFEAAKTSPLSKSDSLNNNWQGYKSKKNFSPIKNTGVSIDTLRDIGRKISRVPSDLTIHPKLIQMMQAKAKSVEAGKDIDWATGEALAFGSLLMEGCHVRLSGQDVERGTFSHRHAVLHHQTSSDRKKYVPLNHLDPKQAYFSVSNSNLSEFGILGFELGYSLESPGALVLWEAQFGDFFNGAQIIVDQFLSSGEDKWLRQSGLVLLLPHGYEGQGPEHSSARLERFLQMCNDNPDVLPDSKTPTQIQESNWQILNCTTPANYFHALRRQQHRDFRKPLIIMTPKSLLRLPASFSTLNDMADGTRFRQVLPEPSTTLASNEKIKRVVFCSGKVYYDMVAKRTELKRNDIAFVRVEQISPFPFMLVAEEAKKYPNAEVVWAQEEPMNMGAYTYTAPRLITALKKDRPNLHKIRYVGRAPSASTAAGSEALHKKELAAFLAELFNY